MIQLVCPSVLVSPPCPPCAPAPGFLREPWSLWPFPQPAVHFCSFSSLSFAGLKCTAGKLPGHPLCDGGCPSSVAPTGPVSPHLKAHDTMESVLGTLSVSPLKGLLWRGEWRAPAVLFWPRRPHSGSGVRQVKDLFEKIVLK